MTIENVIYILYRNKIDIRLKIFEYFRNIFCYEKHHKLVTYLVFSYPSAGHRLTMGWLWADCGLAVGWVWAGKRLAMG